jgi:hypothetical protein
MKTLWCKNQENPSDRISHAWAPFNRVMKIYLKTLQLTPFYRLCVCKKMGRIATKFLYNNFFSEYEYEYEYPWWYLTVPIRPLWIEMRSIKYKGTRPSSNLTPIGASLVL